MCGEYVHLCVGCMCVGCICACTMYEGDSRDSCPATVSRVNIIVW